MTAFRIAVVALVCAGALLLCVWAWFALVANPRVVRELTERPDGERAQRVMLLTLPSGRRIPVNYLREGNAVYAGADGRWWRELAGDGGPVRVLIRGESRTGRGRAVRDDPARRARIFQRLRPNAPPGL